MKEKTEKKGYLHHFYNIGIGTIGNIFLGLLTTPVVTRLVSTDDYGALSVFNTYASMAVMILCFGLDQALIRFYYEEDSDSYKRELIAKTAGLSLATAIPTCFVAYIFLNREDVPFDFKGVLLLALSVYVLIRLFLRFALLVLRVEYMTRFYAMLNALTKAIYLVAAVGMLLFIRDANNLRLLVAATVFSAVIPLLIAIYSKRTLWSLSPIRAKTKVKYKVLLRYGMPFILSMGITTVFEAMDKLFINFFYDYNEVGIYASAVTIVNVFTILQTTFNTVWAPMATETYVREPENKGFFHRVHEIVALIMFLFGFFLILFKDVFILLLGEKYRSASSVVPFLIFHPIMYTVSETVVMGVDFKKRSHLHILAAAAACIANACGNYLLVPAMGGRGAAISTGLAYIVFFAFRCLFGLLNYNYKPKILKIVVLVLITVGFALYSSFVQNIAGNIVIFMACTAIAVILYKDAARSVYTYAAGMIRSKWK